MTTDLITDISESFNVPVHDTLTGFKYIAEIIRELEGKKQFIVGGEESYGYLVGDFVRDKDAVISCCMIAETAAWAADQGKTLYELLPDIYNEYGFYKERLTSIVRKGKEGAEEIQQMMDNYRSNPPKTINNSKLVMIKDYLSSKVIDVKNNSESDIALPKSNVLQFFLEDGSKISVRPSGTEPKIKFYFSVKEDFYDPSKFDKMNKFLDKRIDGIISSLGLS